MALLGGGALVAAGVEELIGQGNPILQQWGDHKGRWRRQNRHNIGQSCPEAKWFSTRSIRGLSFPGSRMDEEWF
jgi:hypothetical protein